MISPLLDSGQKTYADFLRLINPDFDGVQYGLTTYKTRKYLEKFSAFLSAAGIENSVERSRMQMGRPTCLRVYLSDPEDLFPLLDKLRDVLFVVKRFTSFIAYNFFGLEGSSSVLMNFPGDRKGIELYLDSEFSMNFLPTGWYPPTLSNHEILELAMRYREVYPDAPVSALTSESASPESVLIPPNSTWGDLFSALAPVRPQGYVFSRLKLALPKFGIEELDTWEDREKKVFLASRRRKGWVKRLRKLSTFSHLFGSLDSGYFEFFFVFENALFEYHNIVWDERRESILSPVSRDDFSHPPLLDPTNFSAHDLMELSREFGINFHLRESFLRESSAPTLVDPTWWELFKAFETPFSPSSSASKSSAFKKLYSELRSRGVNSTFVDGSTFTTFPGNKINKIRSFLSEKSRFFKEFEEPGMEYLIVFEFEGVIMEIVSEILRNGKVEISTPTEWQKRAQRPYIEKVNFSAHERLEFFRDYGVRVLAPGETS